MSINLRTGIHYGVISARSLKPELADKLIGGCASTTSFHTIRGVCDGVYYRATYIGGHLHFFILSSGYIGFAKPYTTCGKSAGDLGNVVHGPEVFESEELLESARNSDLIECYLVPEGWQLLDP